MIEYLQRILNQVQMRAGHDFSGIGLVVCDAPEALPICPLRPTSPDDSADLVSQLTDISSPRSEYHDGFHIISTDWKLLKVAQYFSPPIASCSEIDRSKRFGGRYLAAMFGSALPAVQACGIASNGFGVAVFQGGKEVYYETAR